MHRRILIFLILLSSMHSYCQHRGATSESKLSYTLYGKRGQDSLTLSISVKKIDELLGQKNLFRILSRPDSSNILVIRIKANEIEKLSLSENVLFVNEFHEPKEELTTGAADLTL